MALDTTQRDSVRRLGQALETHLSVTPAATLDDLWTPKAGHQPGDVAAQYLIATDASALAVRVQLHHDLMPAMLVHDPELLTFGLVELVPVPKPGENVAAEIDKIIDRAAYLRQLCLFEAERANAFSNAVELILLFTRDHPDTQALEQVLGRLRELARETGYLKALSVSLLCEDPDGGYSPENLRRAFPWVLKYTREWFKSAAGRPRQTTASLSSSWTVKLANYRNTSMREYTFAGADGADPDGPVVHLMHGYNGSGKTTFTEALELLLTKQIERLGDPAKTDYYPIVRHHPRSLTSAVAVPPPSGETTITLAMPTNGAAGVTASVTISERPPATAGAPSDAPATPFESVARRWNGSSEMSLLGTAMSFRLDQTFMDDMIRSDESKRATRFLKAFFPQDRSTFDELARVDAALETELAKLPSTVKDAFKESARTNTSLPPALEALEQSPSTWSAGIIPTLAPLLGLTEQQLEMLGRLESSVGTIVERWQQGPTSFSAVEQELGLLQSAFAHLRPRFPEISGHLQAASRFFAEFANWQAAGKVERGQVFEHTLNQWLELQALCDLVTKYHGVMSTLAEARAAGWQAPSAYDAIFKDVGEDESRLDFLKSQRDVIAQARDHARTAVNAWGADATSSADGTPVSAPTRPPRAELVDDEVRSLNEVCQWLPSLSPGTGPPFLGDVAVAALKDEREATRGQCTIGSPNGLKLVAAETDALLAAIRIVEAPNYSTTAIYLAVKSAQAAWKALQEQRAIVQKSFFSRLADGGTKSNELADALHELLALFKPAPWAYQEILLSARLRASGAGAETETLRIMSDNLPAELRLNTAEMNSFTLAVFLLCAPTLENPLRLLVLDDPLQNMDEMTVSSLARGLGRLVRIYPKGWRIVALFHAEEDLHRVRSEVPCAVYRLPWVNPTGAQEKDPIEYVSEESTWKRALPDLSKFITSGPVN